MAFNILSMLDVGQAVNKSKIHAYFHNASAVEHRQFLCFRISGVTYPFRVLPFPLPPKICFKYMCTYLSILPVIQTVYSRKS